MEITGNLRQRIISPVSRLFSAQTIPPDGMDWGSKVWGTVGILAGGASFINLLTHFYVNELPWMALVIYTLRSVIVTAVGVWVLVCNPWRTAEGSGRRLVKMMLIISAAVLVPTLASIFFNPDGLRWLWYHVALILSIAQVFWLARRGYARVSAMVLLLLLIIAVAGMSTMDTSYYRSVTITIYGLGILIGGLMIGWWFAFVIAVVMPLLNAWVAFLGYSPAPPAWPEIFSQIMILLAQAGITGIYSRILETTLDNTDKRAEELENSRAALMTALRQLERSEKHLKTVVSHNPVVIFSLDTKGCFTLMEGEELKELNVDSSRMVGRSAMKLLRDAPEAQAVIEEALANGQSHGVVEILGRIFEVYISRVLDDNGNLREYIGIAADITQRYEAETDMRRSEQNYRAIFNATSDAIFIHHPDTGEVIDVNQSMLDMYGCTYEEALNYNQFAFDPNTRPFSKEDEFKKIRSAITDGPQTFQWLSRRSNGEFFWVEVALSPVKLDGETRVLAVVRDISERKRMEEALYEEKERATVTLKSIGDAVITTNAYTRVEFLNPVAEALTGWTQEEARGKQLDEVFQIMDEHSHSMVQNPVKRCLDEGRIVGLANRTVLLSRNGEVYDIDNSAAPIHSREGDLMGAVLVFHDVTETRRLARQMAYDATHDMLTGLINRREFEDRLEHALAGAKNFGEEHALCYLDLDQFKIINDTAGHAVGDQMLKEVTQLLNGIFRRNDTLARLGGDEFGLLLVNCPVAVAEVIAGNVVNRLNEYRFTWQDRTFQVGVSIGVVAINAKSESTAQVLSQADVACYTAKDLGRARVHIYKPEDSEATQRHSELVQASRLRDAIERGQFLLYCQPIVPIGCVGDTQPYYELLLRMKGEDGKLVPPNVFIGPAERYNLMGAIDRWVVSETFKLYASLFDEVGPNIAINLSGNSLNDDTILDFVLEQLEICNILPDRVCFEITETAAIHNLSKAEYFAREVRRAGAHIALDDFGSGMSSFRYLKSLPVDYLKIDGSFVMEVLDSETDMAMVSAINQMGHSLGIKTIAEHVTSEQIAEKMREMGIDFAQGYGLGRPVPVEEAWKRME